MIMRYKVTLVVLAISLALSLSPSRAERFEKERYREDVIEADDKEIKLKIDPDTGKVASFWDDVSQGWVEASLSPVDLNRAYTDKVTAHDMQDELNRMKNDTWDDRYGR